MTVSVRPARRDDVPAIAGFIRELAEYERLGHAVRFDKTELAANLFGASPCAEVLIGELDGRVSGFALFFPTFSTFEGKPGLWLEDLFVEPGARRQGLGRALLGAVADLARERGCARLEWSVLDWNEPAIRLYRAVGAQTLDDWRTMRVDGALLARFGGS